MSELDKLFKDKLHDREFEFKDSYWEAAERLIEQDEQERRKRGGLWWKLGLLLLLMVAGSYFFMNKQNAASVSESGFQLNQKTEQTDQLAREPDAKLNSEPELKESNTSSIQNSSVPSNTNNPETKTTTSTQTTPAPGAQYNASDANTNALKKGQMNTESLDGLKNAPQLEVEKIKVQAPVPADSVATKKRKIAVVSKPESSDIPAGEITQASNTTIDELSLLETVASEIDIPEADCDGCFDFGKVKSRRFDFGISAESIIYPFDKDRSWWVGGSAGLIARYRIGRRFALRSGLQYALLQSSNDRILSHSGNGAFDVERYGNQYNGIVENQYSFGLRRVETIFPPTTFHSLEIPLVLQFKAKRNTLEAGIQWSLLAGVRGSTLTNYSLFPWEQEALGVSGDYNANEVKTKEWLSKDNYKKSLTRLTIGYRYAVNPQLSFGANTFYRLGKIASNDFESTLSNIGEDKAGDSFIPQRFHFRLSANWYFN